VALPLGQGRRRCFAQREFGGVPSNGTAAEAADR
jgi:hypothetical protein